MNALVAPAPTPVAIGPLLRTLVLCDLANSTALVERLGDQRAAALLRRHDRLARDLVLHHGGQEIDKTDGFLVMFERPIQGVAFALDYQRQLRQLGKDEKLDLRARVGLHVGDVMVWENNSDDVAHGAKRVEVEGLVKPVAARLAGLALPGQILASGVAASLAQRAHGELGEQPAETRWMNHGRYRFKGVPEPLPVYEIGEIGQSPLKAPPWSSKAHREVPWWRRPATVAVESLALCAVLAGTWWMLRPQPAIAFAQRDWVVMGDLKNLTTDKRFDDGLQAAFRIGLEQSRYVNVLSELQVRDALKRMQRDATTSVDRTVGAELALREGARALIIPTVAEVGGKLRVTADVIDPTSQRIVYSESAENVGAESALSSVDQIGQHLRVRLGEALASVSNESRPLEKVATSNLDALRAYSLGFRDYSQGQFQEARSLFEDALKIDPNFALAHVGLARILVSTDHEAEAKEQIRQAGALRDRLSSRESLYVDAWQANFGPPKPALVKWKTLATLYPDFYTAQGTLAFYLWQKANRYDEAIDAATAAASPHNHYRATSDYLLGILLLAQERYTEALTRFGLASQSGASGQRDFFALCHAAQRHFDKADAIYTQTKAFGDKRLDINSYISQVSVLADQGKWEQATAVLEHAVADAGADGDYKAREFRMMRMAALSVAELPKPLAADLTAFLRDEMVALKVADETQREQSLFHILLTGYLAAHLGDSDLAQLARSVSAPELQGDQYPLLYQMSVLAQAENERVGGHADNAITMLKPLLDGTELYLAHVVLMEAYADAGKTQASLAEADWLSSHRGRAYAEFNGQRVLSPLNVIHSNLALLRGAELAKSAGDKALAKSHLAAFEAAWPESRKLKFLDSRMTALGLP
jgi:putative peptide modification system cyclase